MPAIVAALTLAGTGLAVYERIGVNAKSAQVEDELTTRATSMPEVIMEAYGRGITEGRKFCAEEE